MTQFNVTNVEDFFKRIDHLLVDRRWSRAELNRKTGINRGTLNNMWITPKYHPRGDYIFQMAEALSVSVEFLMTGKNTEGKEEVKLSPEKQQFMDFALNTPDHKLKALIKVLKTIDEME